MCVDESHGKMSVGITFTSRAAARPRIATAASFARLITVGLTGSGSRIARVADVDDQRVPLRDGQQRAHRHRQCDVEVAVVQRGNRQPAGVQPPLM